MGGPSTLGRFIRSNRHPTRSAWFRGVAVYTRPLRHEEMAMPAGLERPADTALALEYADIGDQP